ncbi:MAG: hypothetical protein ACT4P1_08930 [Sporichthyaceae bacterium]
MLTPRMLPFVVAVGALVAAAGALATAERGGGGRADALPTTAVSAYGWTLPTQGRPAVRQELASLGADSRYLSHAQSVLIARCMRRQGFTYPVEDLNAPVYPRDARYGLSVEEAKRSGYVSQSQILAVPDEDKSSFPEEPGGREAFGAALFGPDGSSQVEVDIPMTRSELGMSSVGCLADVDRALYGNLETALRRSDVTGNAWNMAEKESGADPGLAVLNQRWSACISKAGYPDLLDPDLASVRARKLTGGRLAGLDTGEPREIAIADATCQQKVDYAPQRRAIEDRYFTALLDHYAEDIAAARAATAAAVFRAKSLLDDDASAAE